MTNTIALPQRTLERITELIRQRDMVTALIDTTLATAREALEVPDGWTINDVRVGFVGEPRVSGSAGGFDDDD